MMLWLNYNNICMLCLVEQTFFQSWPANQVQSSSYFSMLCVLSLIGLIQVNSYGFLKASYSRCRYLICPQRFRTLDSQMYFREALLRKYYDRILICLVQGKVQPTQRSRRFAIEFSECFLSLSAFMKSANQMPNSSKNTAIMVGCASIKFTIALPQFLVRFFVQFREPLVIFFYFQHFWIVIPPLLSVCSGSYLQMGSLGLMSSSLVSLVLRQICLMSSSQSCLFCKQRLIKAGVEACSQKKGRLVIRRYILYQILIQSQLICLQELVITHRIQYFQAYTDSGLQQSRGQALPRDRLQLRKITTYSAIGPKEACRLDFNLWGSVKQQKY